jgi:hypothetical protein
MHIRLERDREELRVPVPVGDLPGFLLGESRVIGRGRDRTVLVLLPLDAVGSLLEQLVDGWLSGLRPGVKGLGGDELVAMHEPHPVGCDRLLHPVLVLGVDPPDDRGERRFLEVAESLVPEDLADLRQCLALGAVALVPHRPAGLGDGIGGVGDIAEIDHGKARLVFTLAVRSVKIIPVAGLIGDNSILY